MREGSGPGIPDRGGKVVGPGYLSVVKGNGPWIPERGGKVVSPEFLSVVGR